MTTLTDGKKIIVFRNKPITECDRNELLHCIEWCMEEIEMIRRNSIGDAELYQAFIKAKP